MKRYLIVFALWLPLIVTAQQNRSLSPYFLVQSSDSTQTERMPLRATSADVNIAGVIANVEIRQVYENTGKTPIEAIYVFPGSTQAAVYGMEMKIGTRTIKAKIEEREAARQQYEAAKSEGKRASLLEQERPNVFQMNVANIMPGDKVEVLLQYTELLIPEAGVYEFMYPTVVGPRYYNETKINNSGYSAMPYTKTGATPSYEFDLKVRIDGGMPIQNITSPSHKIQVLPDEGKAMRVALAPSEREGGNRDFILRYSYRGDKIQTGMLVYEDGDEQFFLCMAQPPQRVNQDEIPPREYIFVVDVSGSMTGYPLDVSKELLRNLIKDLRPTDRFNIMLFAGGNQLWAEESQTATQENLDKALHFLSNLRGGGGTNLLPALKRSLRLPRKSDKLSRSIIIVTDGYVTVESEAFDLIRTHLDRANVFAFGIGSSVNRHLIEGLARVGQGTPFIVTNQSEAAVEAEKLRQYIGSPLLTQITVCFDGIETYDVEPLTIPDVMSDRPVIIFGKYKGELEGNIYLQGYTGSNAKTGKGTSWFTGKTQKAQTPEGLVQFAFNSKNANTDARNVALKYLWARERIRNIADYNQHNITEAAKAETTRLGLKYNLLTAYTSFIAVEEDIANEQPDATQQVKQPLPLPQGVSNHAVGFALSISGISGAELLANNRVSIRNVLFYALFSFLGVGFIITLVLRNRRARHFLNLCLLAVAFTSCDTNSLLHPVASSNPHDSVTFILGQDQSNQNPYYETALKYFSTDSLESTPLIVQDCNSMLAVRHYLEQHRPHIGAWKQVNLVVHGNQWTGINLPVLEGSARCSAESLKAAAESGNFPALPDDVLNAHSRISIFGCNVGQDTLLLRAISQALGGKDAQRPLVHSARYFNLFQDEGSSFGRYLAECRFVAIPAGTFPGNRALAQRFAEKYPNDSTDWMTALLTLHPENNTKAYTHYFSIPANWAALYPELDARPELTSEADHLAWVRAEADLMRILDQMDIAPEAFRWTSKASDMKGLPMLEVEGQTIIYCILKPVFDEQQHYARTSVEDGRYYAMVR